MKATSTFNVPFRPGTTRVLPPSRNPLLDQGHGETRWHVRWGGGHLVCGYDQPVAAMEQVARFHGRIECDVVITRVVAAPYWTHDVDRSHPRSRRYHQQRCLSVFQIAEVAELAATQQPRCLGCGEPMPTGRWEQHGTCRPYYGAGDRVDYAAFLALIDRFSNDGPIFQHWADGEPHLGLPSWFSDDLATSLRDSVAAGRGAWMFPAATAARSTP